MALISSRVGRWERGASLHLPAPLTPLTRGFYLRPTLAVARELLGKILIHLAREGATAGRIVEVEAYLGERDRAAHSYGGRRTRRNEAMYRPGGSAYVYFIYGMHHCFNVVTGPAGIPQAVLIRALEPLAGVEPMRKHRSCPPGTPAWKLARGPANLCRAMGIDLRLNRVDLTRSPLLLCDAPPVPRGRVGRSTRIGIGYAGADAERRWRFFVTDSRAVSGPKGANGRPERKATRRKR